MWRLVYPPTIGGMKRLPLVLAWFTGIVLCAALLLVQLHSTASALLPEDRFMMFVFGAGPFLLIRRWPLATVVLLLAGLIVTSFVIAEPYIRSEYSFIQFAAVDVAIGVVAARHRARITSVTAIAAFAVQAALIMIFSVSLDPVAELMLPGLAVVAAAMIGSSIRQRRLSGEAQRARAAVEAVVAERLRIAREVHDMVAHSIAVIAIQAGMGRRVMQTQPAEAGRALDTIEVTSRQTLAGLRRTLSALRQGAAPLEPLPGLSDLDQLAASAAGAGVTVTIERLGTPYELPGDVELSAYRIVQEAVSNVVRHAGTDQCHVTVRYRETEIGLEVVDNGRGCDELTPGYGIVGMRERAELHGGSFSAGTRPEGGFRVAVTLPVRTLAGAV